MSTSLMEMDATIQALLSVNQALAQITTPILMVIGNVGELLNILVFVQGNFRNNSCAIYFLAAACIRLVFINYTILFNGLALGYNVDPATTSLVACKLKFYFATVTAILPPHFIVLACIDRLASSSMSVRARAWSRPYVAYRMVAVVTLFWVIFSAHALVGGAIDQESGYSLCYIQGGVYTVFVAFYSVICNYLLPPVLMTVFGLLTIINIRRTRRQVHTTSGLSPMTQKDRYLFQMLLFQVVINIIFTIPAGVFQFYRVISANWNKDSLQQTWDLVYLNIALFLFFIPNCAGFYIYTLSGSIFRQELRRLFTHCLGRFSPWQQQTTVTVVNTFARS